MKMHDFNVNKEKVILLIHPMLSSANAIKMFITHQLGNEYHYLIPDLSGHGEDSKRTYKSAKIEAEAIHSYLKENKISNLQFGFGASLGGVVLFELLKYNDINFKHVFFEGTSFYEHASLLNFILAKVFLKKHRKAILSSELSVKKMESLYGKETALDMAMHFIDMTEESIKNIVHDCAYVNLLELSEEIQYKCTFAYGKKDSDLKKAKKIIPIKYPKANFKVWDGYGHCEKMTSESKEYAKMLQSYWE